MNRCMYVSVDGWMGGWRVDRWWKDGWIGGGVDRWIGGWMMGRDEWMNQWSRKMVCRW